MRCSRREVFEGGPVQATRWKKVFHYKRLGRSTGALAGLASAISVFGRAAWIRADFCRVAFLEDAADRQTRADLRGDRGRHCDGGGFAVVRRVDRRARRGDARVRGGDPRKDPPVKKLAECKRLLSENCAPRRPDFPTDRTDSRGAARSRAIRRLDVARFRAPRAGSIRARPRAVPPRRAPKR